jgi:hypothetical protein
MDDRVGLLTGQQRFNQMPVADIAFDDAIAVARFHCAEVLEIPSVGKLIEIHHPMAGLADEQSDKGRTDESGSASN